MRDKELIETRGFEQRPTQDIPESILGTVQHTRLTRSGVTEISEVLKESSVDVHALIRLSLEKLDGHSATILMVAATMCGEPLKAGEVRRLLPLLPDVRMMAPLVGICTGDRQAMLMELLESGQLSWERQALGLLLFVELLEGMDPPPRLLALIRLLARENVGPEAGALLGLAARGVKDPATQEVAAAWVSLAATPLGKEMQASIRKTFAQDPASVLTEREEPRLSGFTIRRAVPKIGRNAPCPCGSGRKYKKCCARKDVERLADPSPVAGITLTEYMAQPEQYMDDVSFRNLSVREVARLDFDVLGTDRVISALHSLSLYRLWDAAERAMKALSSRRDLPEGCPVDDYRAELIGDAIQAHAYEVVQRQVSLIQDKQALERYRIELELLTPRSQTLKRLEEKVLEGLREPQDDHIIDLANALLDHFPGLGILAARAALNPNRPFDMEFLLEEIEKARDRLQLPPGDMALGLYELLLEQDLSNRIKESESQEQVLANQRILAEAAERGERLKEAATKISSLERRLRQQEEILRKANLEAQRIEATHVSQGRRPTETDEAELTRLREKVSALKGLIAESQKERGELRKRIAEATHRLEKAGGGAKGHVGELKDQQAPSGDPLELASEMPSRLSTVIPHFSESAQKAIREAPSTLALQALRISAALAGGDPSAWEAVKRLRRISDLWSARVGIHHRLLFRLDHARTSLEIVAFIPRNDLEVTLKNLSHGRGNP